MSLRNIAIIAHVDHGKTTLVDKLMHQSGLFRENQQVDDRAMDRNDLERERGITILSKCTSVTYGDTRVNIVDTPGHADFGGEVERILSMVDGVALLVDAAEGPMPQTKFVTGKALKLGLEPMVIINKADRPDARADEVLDEIFDLFVGLEASEEQLDFPVLYASAKEGWAVEDLAGESRDGMKSVFDLILRHVPAPANDPDKPFRMLATTLDSDPYIGRVLTGRIHEGRIKVGDTMRVLRRDGSVVESGRISKLLAYHGLDRVPVEEAEAGDIVAVAGLQNATVADTIAAAGVEEPIPAQPIDPPTIAVIFSVNDSPLAGKEGDKVTSRMIRDRLMKESEGNVAITVRETEDKDAFEVGGRGELQLGVLVETMRREGFELSVSRPRVLYQTDDKGNRLEPIEDVVVDVDEEFSGAVVEKVALRKGQLEEMKPSGAGKQRLVFKVPSRGLVGYHGEFLTDTRGTGIMHRIFSHYDSYRGPIEGRRNGALVSMSDGEAVPYALWNLEERGVLFIGAGEKVYQGMVIGENAKPSDMEVNPLKAKQLTNVRASGKDDAVRLTPPRRISLEDAIAYIDDDELVEVTPKSVRLRKTLLDPTARKRASKQRA